MNGKIKFHKPNGPAFAVGEEWISANGMKVTITKVTCIGDGKFDYLIDYLQSDGTSSQKDGWNFQVRYNHQADKDLR